MSDQLNIETEAVHSGPVEVLGLSFENDIARRAYFLEKLREKLKDAAFREIEGFPLGSDEDIMKLSDPPFYTACPNPWLGDFVTQGNPATHSEPAKAPFATDISEGKGDYYYNVHTYHTKVPYKAIARFLLHYTRPDAVVLDAFAGTGMTGLAAQACANPTFVRELDPACSTDLIGPRRVILADLSPAATHIAYNYNAHVDWDRFAETCTALLHRFKQDLGWMFNTVDPDSGETCLVDYYIWSDVFACPECGHELVFWEEAVDQDTGHKTGETALTCSECKAESPKNSFTRVEVTYFDDLRGTVEKRQKEKLISIVYRRGSQQLTKEPDDADFAILDRIDREPMPDPVPVIKMLRRDGPWGDMFRAGYHLGITHFHHFYNRRSLRAVAYLWARIDEAPIAMRPRLRWWLQSVTIGHTRMNRYFSSSYSQVNRYLKGFLYIAQVRSEVSPWYALSGKIGRMAQGIQGGALVYVSTGSASDIRIPDQSVDYIFTDPPFGGNIIYSELNFMWEAWLGVFTEQTPEAIMSGIQKKDLGRYESLMQRCFDEYFRVLKPGRWMTILFHNSSNAVWAAIQSALERSGFVVADVRIFDKKQLTMKQQTTAGAVQKDLLISTYRPNGTLEKSISLSPGSAEGAWNFVRQHLRHLPIAIENQGRLEIALERQAFMLFDRMLAFHVQRGLFVPVSAAEFYEGLSQRFEYRDGMWFLSDQVAEYEKKKQTVSELKQLELIIRDESSAIQWLRQQLVDKPQRLPDLQPQFMRETVGWSKEEQRLELAEILRLNFLCYEGEGEVPVQIRNYLSKNFHDLRGLAPGAAALQQKARDRWYVPDPNKAVDLEKLRERELLKTFEDYRSPSIKKIKVPRLEALRAGFKRAWDERDYATIVEVATKIPNGILQEDAKLLMFYDNAATRLGVG